MAKILFATDVHGSDRTFRKFTNAAKLYAVDTLILGGDLTGKMLVPIVKQSDKTCLVEFLGNTCKLKTEEEILAMEKKINDSGYYSYRTDREEVETISKEKVDQLFIQLMKERLISWIRLIEERLRGAGIQVYMTGGNDDPLEIEEVLNSSDCVVNAEGKACRIDDSHEMISTGLSNATPWKTRREVDEDKLEKSLETMVSEVTDVSNCIFNFHAPPKDSELDTCPLLDASVHPPKPVMKSGQIVMYGAGSIAVRKSVEKYQPLLGLFGHIHESRGVRKIGRTICINPGSEYSEGILRAAIVILERDKVKTYQLTSG